MIENSEQDKIWSVSEVNSAVRAIVENSLTPFWLKAEVGTCTIHRSGHVYLNLKDDRCQLRAVYFSGAGTARKLGLVTGMEIEVFGSLTVYEPRGDYQFSIRSMRPLGVGDLQRRFDELKRKLDAEGLFDPSLKKPIPILPRRIGVVSSPSGAAIRDFLQIINRRFPDINIKIYPTAVQGKGAEAQIARGVWFFNQRQNVDVIVVTRGGGSMEDLWPFNEEILARHIAGSRIPVISAVGHEIDFTICDFVADLRVPTPSAAAEIVIGRQEEFTEMLKNSRRRMRNSMALSVERLKNRFNTASGSYVFKEPAHMVREKQQEVDELFKSMEHSIKLWLESKKADYHDLKGALRALTPIHAVRDRRQTMKELRRGMSHLMTLRLESEKASLKALAGRLRAIDPKAVLKRGYSIITDSETGKIVSSPDTPPGTRVKALISDGELDLTVLGGRKVKR